MRAGGVPSAERAAGDVYSPKSSMNPSLPWARASLTSRPYSDRAAGAVKSNWASGSTLKPPGPSPPTKAGNVIGRASAPRWSAPAATASSYTGW
jgi:hypothetical protein